MILDFRVPDVRCTLSALRLDLLDNRIHTRRRRSGALEHQLVLQNPVAGQTRSALNSRTARRLDNALADDFRNDKRRTDDIRPTAAPISAIRAWEIFCGSPAAIIHWMPAQAKNMVERAPPNTAISVAAPPNI